MKVKQSITKISNLNPRIILSVITIIVILAVLATGSLAGFSGVVMNNNNKITTANVSLSLMTMDKPVDVTALNLKSSDILPLPKTTDELFGNNNTLISLNDDENTARKFFEYDGKKTIENVQPKFRLLRPLIIQNTSNSNVNYTVEFLTKEISNPGLSTAFFFNYTKVGGDIPNQAMVMGEQNELPAGETVNNLGVDIKKIGDTAPIVIKANSTHIYMVDMGIAQTAGNSYQDAGLMLDIVLASSVDSNITRAISDQASFKNAVMQNTGGDTLTLTKSVTIDSAIISNNAFNLDLNGNTLQIIGDGSLTINFPNAPSTMDFGSNKGGRVVGADTIKFVGIEGKSVLNWYTDITGCDMPKNSVGVIINPKTMDIPTDNTGGETSSSPTAEYIDFNKIVTAQSYADGDGKTMKTAFVVETPEQFKRFVEDKNAIWFTFNKKIANITNVPIEVVGKTTRVSFSDGSGFECINLVGQSEYATPNFLAKSSIYYNQKILVDASAWFSEISYNGITVK